MNLLNFVKGEIKDWTKLELVFFPLSIALILIISTLKNDNIIALISAICGITYTIFAGKGKISCYFFGIIATLCYSYLAFINAFWGNFALNFLYYFPLSIIGIMLWKRNLKKDKQEIEKTKLTTKERNLYFSLTFFITLLLMLYFKSISDKAPFFDAFTTVFSILGMLLTVKRCIEQWYVWFFVNIFSATMWIISYFNGVACISIILKWLIYAILAVYFSLKWKKEVL